MTYRSRSAGAALNDQLTALLWRGKHERNRLDGKACDKARTLSLASRYREMRGVGSRL